jgi:hypothetical protein
MIADVNEKDSKAGSKGLMPIGRVTEFWARDNSKRLP